MWPRPGAELELAAAVHADAALVAVVVGVAQLARPPTREGLTFTIRGGNGSASMSATPWIGRVPGDPVVVAASTGSVSAVSAGSSIQASGNASATRGRARGRRAWSTTVPL